VLWALAVAGCAAAAASVALAFASDHLPEPGLRAALIAALLVAGAFAWPAFETIRNITFGAIGLAPLAFLTGPLSARLARSAVADLVVELRADPAPADLPQIFARALGDHSLTVAYWLPQYESWADLHGRPVELPAEARDGQPR
jgi:hypothetical protein